MKKILTEQEKTEINKKNKELFENYNPQDYKTKEEKFKACQAISLDEFQEMGIRRIKELTDVMVYLKEDGSLDVEKIRKLQLEEKMKVIHSLTKEQKKEYWDKVPCVEGPPKVIKVDYPMEQDGVDAFEFLKKMRQKYEHKMAKEKDDIKGNP